MSDPRPLRALVVDDSGAARAAVARLVEDAGARVVAEAADGEEALALALELGPDVVFLDLRMPRMDGFTFLRLLMAQRPTPVVVVSSLRARSDVFKALELGALDFVAKPEDGAPPDAFREALRAKCAMVRALRLENLPSRPARRTDVGRAQAFGEPAAIAVVGASTGGPQALQRLLAALPGDLPLAVLIAQHMPERFTGTFAERLARTTRFAVQEAEEGDLLARGRALVAPGGRHLEIRRDRAGALRAQVRAPLPAPRGLARLVPSIDLLFASAARTLGPRACGVVLTGMGSDGAAGLVEMKAAGALTIAESQDSAVVYGMPQSAVERGAADEVLPLDALADRLVRFARSF